MRYQYEARDRDAEFAQAYPLQQPIKKVPGEERAKSRDKHVCCVGACAGESRYEPGYDRKRRKKSYVAGVVLGDKRKVRLITVSSDFRIPSAIPFAKRAVSLGKVSGFALPEGDTQLKRCAEERGDIWR